jgi:branched-chain amino acid transport system ATP-binding protein
MMGTSITAVPRCKARDVTVRFGGVLALNQVELDVPSGLICGLIGSNGAGKSTLFDVLSGFTRPQSGVVMLDGADVTARSATWRSRHGVRRTFQRQQVFGHLTVYDNLLAATESALPWWTRAGEIAGVRRPAASECHERVNETLALCAIDRIADATAAHLPIGDLRMVELARAIVARPRVLLLDEPTSGLDRHEKARVSGVMQELRRREDCSVLLVEHDMPFVVDNCELITVLHVGQVIASGSPSDVIADPAVVSAYLS